jgi:rSAM/selenodomain-associated transferase 2
MTWWHGWAPTPTTETQVMNAVPPLSVVIPCLNEAQRLPLLLADLQLWPFDYELLLVDGGSRDRSATIAALAGARVLHSLPPCRGRQLATGANQAQHAWLLFLHADSRLPRHWAQAVGETIKDASLQPGLAMASAWFFPLCIAPATAARRLLERAVHLRSHLGQTPYGDQGLLIHKSLYQASGGFAPLPLMEDLDLVQRIRPRARLRGLNCPLTTDGRRWDRSGVVQRSWQNAQLRRRWRRGESPERLASLYSGRRETQLAYQKPQR